MTSVERFASTARSGLELKPVFPLHLTDQGKMIVFDVPRVAGRDPVRAAVFGTCRVMNPIDGLNSLGEVTIRGAALVATNTVAETAQLTAFVDGELKLPRALFPYVFNSNEGPETDKPKKTMRGAECFILEVADDKQITYGGYCLQQTYFSGNLIQPYRGALLEWFRTLCIEGAVDEARVEAALEKIRIGGLPCDDEVTALLRGARLCRVGTDEIGARLYAMMSAMGGRWIVLGTCVVPGHNGAIMRDRRVLNGKIAEAARRCGAIYYDPSELIVEHGVGKVLAADGADIYHFAPEFNRIVGETLLGLIRQGPNKRRRAGLVQSGEIASASPLSALAAADLADRLNAELVRLHECRLAVLGPEASGLYAHYEARLRDKALVGARERVVLDLVDRHLPAYDAYGVLRGGLGETALLLAATGRQVIAFEDNKNRRSAIEAGLAHLEAVGLIEPGKMSVAARVAPEGPLKGRVLGIGIGNVHVADEAAAAPLQKRMSAFEGLLIDWRSFFRARPDLDDQAALLESLRALKFTERKAYPGSALSWLSKSKTSKAQPRSPSIEHDVVGR